MLLAASPLFGSLGILGAALVACIVLLFVIRAHPRGNVDPVDQLTADVRARANHPVRFALAHPLTAARRRLLR